MAVLTVIAVIAAEAPKWGHPANSLQAATTMPDGDLRSARITQDLDGKGCWQQIFDNQTGRMKRSQQPCEATAYDSNGMPVPIGTIHRLDAISKSFAGH